MVVGLTFVFGEVGVRWFTDFRYTAPPIFAPSEIIPWQLKPDVRTIQQGYWNDFRVTITTNHLGYRDEEFSPEKLPGRFRILALGDSFTFGFGVENEEAYPEVLERLLNERVGTGSLRYEVINAGFASGYAPDTALAYFRHQGFALKPDLVLLGYFGGNDLSDLSYTQWAEVDQQGLPLRITTKVTYVDSLGRLRTASWLGMWGSAPVGRSALQRVKVLARDHSQFLNFVVQQYRLWMISRGRTLDLDHFPSTGEEHLRAAVAKLDRTLTGLKMAVEKCGSHLLIVDIPWRERVSAGESSDSEALIQAWAAQHHVPLVDLARSLKGSDDLYFRVDSHWNARGHAAAAQAILTYLDQMALAPARRVSGTPRT